MSEFIIPAEKRADIGKGASRRLRRLKNRIPAVVYGAKKSAESITVDHDALLHMQEDPHFFTSILNIELEGKKQEVVIKALQRHPFKPKLIHADFLRIDADSEVTMHVPLLLVGESPGVKAGGILTKGQSDVVVRGKPKEMPEEIEVDITALELNGNIFLGDLKIAKGLVLVNLTETNNPAVISVKEPISEAAAEAEDAAAAGDPVAKDDSEDAADDSDSSDASKSE